ncbi:MAG: NapC/NirT family cytochrome c [Phycisphaerae bacterium]
MTDFTGKPKRSGLRRFLRVGGITLLAVVIVGGVALGSAEHYTAQPTFCRSCHVMEPYFTSWSHDLHGNKLHVRCVDCHYAPGERLTFRAKFKGLSQVASYFSGRYGTGRPRAHVSNESCMTAACHGDKAFMKKRLEVGEARSETRMVAGVATTIQRQPTVHYFHEKHLDDPGKLGDVTKELEALRTTVRGAITSEQFERLAKAATSVKSPDEREADLRHLLEELAPPESVQKSAVQWMLLEHRVVRLKQLAGLSCASCHNFDATGTGHISVNRNVCFTCHFTNEQFNQRTGECLKCHEPQTREIAVHQTAGNAPVMMDHGDIIRRNINCVSCHRDVVRGSSNVSARECTHCHDQEKFLAEFENRNTATVAEYHRVHVVPQRARCQDCHQIVTHGLIDPQRIASGAGYLEPVLNDCQHCHPSHHSEQVSLLMGTGGAGITQAMPNAMMGSRINCSGCHVQSANDFKGDALVKATAQACVNCHSSEYAPMFEQWKAETSTYLTEVETQLKQVDELLGGRPAPDSLRKLIEQARQNVHLVKTGGALHNKPFALQLLDHARRNLDQAHETLTAQQ